MTPLDESVIRQGSVTAREITSFDWWGTQLVLLSVCEIGVGGDAIRRSVYGIWRALVLAVPSPRW